MTDVTPACGSVRPRDWALLVLCFPLTLLLFLAMLLATPPFDNEDRG